MRFAKSAPLRFTHGVWSKFVNILKPRRVATVEPLLIGSRQVPLRMVRHPRARRYLLRLSADGAARVTIPRGGNQIEARQFVERNLGWLAEQFQRQQARPSHPARWLLGSEIWLRGERVKIEFDEPGQIRFGSEVLSVANLAADMRPEIEKYLRRLAATELPPRVMELATLHGVSVQRVSVRNQKSRWGSCSRRGTISLNWRLIQTPARVCDYIILHELAHRRHMNHSDQFWQEVERLCPDYREAELWLKEQRSFFW